MKFKKLSNFDGFDQNDITLRAEVPAVMADAFITSKRTVDKINKASEEQEKNADEFVKLQNRRESKLDIDHSMYKKMKLVKDSSTETIKEEKEPKPKWKRKGWDLWTRVHNNLKSNLGNDANNEVETDNSFDRYEVIGTDYDGNIEVYAHDPKEFDFARKVANHFNLKVGEPTPRSKDTYYKYTLKIYIPEEEISDWVD